METLWVLVYLIWISTYSFVYSRSVEPIYKNNNGALSGKVDGECPGDIWCRVRLPQYIVPYHYNLLIKADVSNLRFEGQQTVYFDLTNSTNTIVIHTKEMNISTDRVKSVSTNIIYTVAKQFIYKENEYFVVILSDNLPLGKYLLTLNFNAEVSTKLTGFYRSSYKENGTEEILLTTKFQPTDARKAFPCFDEPDLKATFDISIVHPYGYHAASNMPGMTSPSFRHKSWLKTTFQKTVIMSTYLVAFIVSKFENKFNGFSGIEDNVKLAIWSRPDHVDITEYAYNTSKMMVTFIEQFLNVQYSLPKIDMFAIPDYGSGATEHWGIITYRESKLLYLPGETSVASQKGTAAIIAHEIAHFWFGNLVTCKWWNDLWVQEGMASYLEYYLLDHTHPKWNIKDSYITSELIPGLRLDALQSSHPLSQPLNHPKKIKEIFDTITYRKGASLFGMLDSFLGTEMFRDCLNAYLTEFAYKGATVDDIWNSFSKVSGMNMSSMMKTWTLQMGFPLITIKKIDSSIFLFKQERFLYVKSQGNVTKNYKWIIPFKYAESVDLKKGKVSILSLESTIVASSAEWLLGNYNHKGFYRVNYDAQGWEHIIRNMISNHKIFSIPDRAGVLDNAFALARADIIPYSIPLRLSKYLKREESEIIWKIFMDNMQFLNTLLSSENYYEQFRAWYGKLLKRKVQKKRNARFVSAACKYGDRKTIRFAQETFQKWVKNGTLIPKDLRKQIYICAIANGGDEEWSFAFQKYLIETIPAERSNLQSALSSTQKPCLLNKWLRATLDSTKVRSQDTVYVIRRVASHNPIGKIYAWLFAENNWTKIIDIAMENNFHVNVLISGLTSQFTSEDDLRRVRSLFNKYDSVNDLTITKQSIENIKINMQWLERNRKEMSALFKGR